MKKKDLLSKWLDHDLTNDELKAFKELDAFSSFVSIDEAAERFKAPAFDTESAFVKLKDRLPANSPTPAMTLKRFVLSTAAILVIALGLYFALYYNAQTTVIAERGSKTEFVLPDASEVYLNAGSTLAYNDKNWDDERIFELQGEAFFKVEKGSKFTVKTQHGTITVLGTEFNIQARPDSFAVVCYEGMVEVVYNDIAFRLSAGNAFELYNGMKNWYETDFLQPSWIENKSVYRSVRIQKVLDELSRQYGIEISSEAIDKNTIFTGSFTHEDLPTALKAITIPLDLEYEINEKTVTLKK